MSKNLFIPVSDECHQALKEYCVRKKITMSQFIEKLINKELKIEVKNGK